MYIPFVSSFFVSVFVFYPQSYALYIIGDENATSTHASKYLVKLYAGLLGVDVCFVTNLKDHLLVFQCLCVD